MRSRWSSERLQISNFSTSSSLHFERTLRTQWELFARARIASKSDSIFGEIRVIHLRALTHSLTHSLTRPLNAKALKATRRRSPAGRHIYNSYEQATCTHLPLGLHSPPPKGRSTVGKNQCETAKTSEDTGTHSKGRRRRRRRRRRSSYASGRGRRSPRVEGRVQETVGQVVS